MARERRATDAFTLLRLRTSACRLSSRHWHPATRPQAIDPATGSVTWLQLKVIRADNNAVSGVVEFVARYKVNGKAYRLHEVSQFVKENGLWLYVNGEMQP